MNPSTELSVTRFIAAPPPVVYDVYTNRTRDWFTPRPWTTAEVDFNLRPGGRANVTMQSPEGERHAYQGVFLEIVPAMRIVSTSAFAEGWVPQPGGLVFVAITTFANEGTGTRYTARALHWDEASARAHREMGFEAGWAAAADQLAEIAERM